MQYAFWRSDWKIICILLFSQEEDSNLTSQEKGKAREEVILNYFLASTLYDQSKIPFNVATEKLSVFLFKQYRLILKNELPFQCNCEMYVKVVIFLNDKYVF